MKNCMLCNENPADKKGSHIVPHFLLKRIHNEPGQSGRDKEIGFVIKEGYTNSYFGRAVQPEKLEKIYGEITEELIENNETGWIVDNYFCSNCESNIAVIESEYAKTIESNTEINANYISLNTPFIGFLFWISILWRLSIQEKSGFKLKLKEERKLNRILKHHLKPSIKDIKPDGKDYDLNDIGYKLLRAPNFSNEHNTWLHWSVFFKRPYSLIIDEYLLFVYFKKNHLNGIIMDFYDTEKHKQKAVFNTPFKTEYVYGLPYKSYEETSNNIIAFLSDKRIKSLGNTLDLLHQKIGGEGKQMHPRLKEEIIKRIANSNVELGNKQTIENQNKIIVETLMELKDNSLIQI